MQSTNDILFGDEGRKRVQAGMDEVADAVKVTLGPRGRNVILDVAPEYQPLSIVNDGVTVARAVNPKGSFEKRGAKIIKTVAERTNDVAGDGTTTATILMQAIVKAGMQQLGNGADAVALRQSIEAAAEEVLGALHAQKVETKDLESLVSVATISCGDPKLAKIVAEVVHKLGADGVITLEDAESEDTTSELSEGLELRGGIQLPIFITNQARQHTQLDNVPIFVTDHDLTNGLEVVKFMELCGANGQKAAVIIANSISGEAMATCVINHAQGKFTLVPIRVQAFGEQGQGLLRDIAAATGGTFFAKEEGFHLPITANDSYDWDHFGHADRLLATKDRTTIIGGGGDREARIKELEAQLPNIKVAYNKDQTKQRIARLKSGVGTISVGAITDTEREERKLRIEDAINATKAALDSGIVAGGGAALYRAAQAVKKTQGDTLDAGFAAVLAACEAPIRQMALNSGVELGSTELGRLKAGKRLTIDFRSGEVVHGIDTGIIDPYKVVSSALRNAASEAALFLTSEAVIVNEEEPAAA